MTTYQFTFFEKVMHEKSIEAETEEQACEIFMQQNTIDEDNLSIDYELKNEKTGEFIDIRNVDCVKYYL